MVRTGLLWLAAGVLAAVPPLVVGAESGLGWLLLVGVLLAGIGVFVLLHALLERLSPDEATHWDPKAGRTVAGSAVEAQREANRRRAEQRRNRTAPPATPAA